jgi:aspartyl-tRNA(Asn)/glutamyl-tRNA(Gln) amidotransferase subunit A
MVRKDISSRELTEHALKRIEQSSDLNAFITVCPDEALKAAKEADDLRAKGDQRPLLGVPIAVKDLILTKGIKTTAASRMLANYIPPYDATVIRKLKEAGAVIIGKANLDEFAMGSSNEHSHFGPVKNPWDKERVPGGSSGGSAVAVAARLCPFSLGTDTGGSIRQPASLSGVVGLKPTYGRVSRYGVIAYASSLDQVGVFARSVEECALLTETISGRDPLDSTSVETSPVDKINTGVKGLRIGIPKEYFTDAIEPEVNFLVQEAIKTLETMGAKIVHISLPHTELALACYYIIAPAEASSNLARYDGIRYGLREEGEDLFSLYANTREAGFGDEVKRRILIGTYVLSSGYYDAYYKKAQQVRRLIQNDFSNAFKDYCDLILAPVSPFPAWKLGEKISDPLKMYLSDILTIPVNLAGLPGMSVPCGFTKDKLPVGLQLIGRPFDEKTLYQVGATYQKETNFHNELPPGVSDEF